jgi:hypothetical protein
MKPDTAQLASLGAIITEWGFRHVFRHSYDFQLDPDKLSRLVRDWTAARPELLAALTRFRDGLIARVRAEQ